MNRVSECESAHIHAFSLSGRRYLVNASKGQIFAIPASGEKTSHGLVSPDDLRRFGYFDNTADGVREEHLPPNRIGSVLLNVTHHCNLACAYCVMAMPDLKHAYHDEKQSLDEGTGRAAIDFLAEVGYRDVVSLTFFGGEPLLKFDLIKRLVEYADARYPKRFLYQLITNGCLMQPSMYNFFREHQFSFLWSLDGEPEVHDRLRRFKANDDSVFAQSFAALLALREAWPQCRIGVNITYFKQTLELPGAVYYFRNHGIEAIRMDRGLVPRDSPHAVGLDDIERVKTQLSEVADAYLAALLRGEVFSLNPFVNYMRVISKRLPRSRACNAGLDYITISATGEIYSCYKLLGFEDCRLGDVHTGFSRDAPLKLWQRLDVGQRPGCSECWGRFICAGGCTADNRHLNGNYTVAVSENCAIFLHAIERSADLYFTLLQRAPSALKILLGRDHLAGTDCPRRRGDVLQDDGAGGIENTESGAAYQLNDSAALIFSLCDGTRTFDDIASRLAEDYGLPPTVAQMDCREQLFHMARAGLVDIPANNEPTIKDGRSVEQVM